MGIGDFLISLKIFNFLQNLCQLNFFEKILLNYFLN